MTWRAGAPSPISASVVAYALIPQAIAAWLRSRTIK